MSDRKLTDVAAQPSTLDKPLLDDAERINEEEDGEVEDDDPSLPLCGEIWNLVKISVPIFLMQCAWVAMNVTDSALLGHAGTSYLNAQALQSLWTSSTGVFLTGQVLIVFCAQTYGAGNHKLVGVWAQVVIALICIS